MRYFIINYIRTAVFTHSDTIVFLHTRRIADAFVGLPTF